MKHWRQIFWISLILLTFISEMKSQTFPYVLRGENRYEGIIENPDPPTYRDIDLISFTGFVESVDSDSVNLHMLFYLPHSATIEISAQKKTSHGLYCMRPTNQPWTVGWSEFYPWPTAEVMDPLEIKIKELYFLANITPVDSDTTNVIPLHIYGHNRPTTIEEYLLWILPKVDLKPLEVLVYKDTREKPAVKYEFSTRVGRGQEQLIPFRIENSEPGPYTLEIRGIIETYFQPAIAIYRFYHKDIIENAETN